MTNTTLIHGNCIEEMAKIESGSIDAIITDPPYKQEFEYLYAAMAKEAKRVLRRGGSLVTLCGHYQLHRTLPAIAEHLKYRWTIKVDQPGRGTHMAMGIITTWKPMPWFVNEVFSPRRNVFDSITAKEQTKKTTHPWEQNEGYALWGIYNLTDVGNTILDPFMGSGTTGIAAIDAQRNFIGIEIEKSYFSMAEKRINEVLSQTRLPHLEQI